MIILVVSMGLGGVSLVPGSVVTREELYLGLILALILALGGLLLRFRRRGPDPDYIVLDGSNVMYWLDARPSLASVRIVVGALQRMGKVPVVWFDANAGYLVDDRYLGPELLARRIGAQARHVFVAPKGTPADPLLLDGARTLGARVVSNDRFRDWGESRPWLTEPGFLVSGQIRGEVAELRLGDEGGFVVHGTGDLVRPTRVVPARRRTERVR